uniref:Uncharacterized protein n=2 Tax=Anguilla anguilla TaxID=7936 RepID=A0A0E9TBH0_ANGAN
MLLLHVVHGAPMTSTLSCAVAIVYNESMEYVN